MKWNCYDLFDYYDAETQGVPSLRTEPVDTDAVKKRVYTQIETESEKRRRHFRLTKWIAGLTAAAALVVGGRVLTVAAGYGGFDEFFQSLFVFEAPESPDKMENLVTAPDVSFDSTNEDVQFSLLGMYGDQSQALLSFRVTAENGVELSEDLASVVDMIVTGEDGVSNSLIDSGNWYGLKASATEENVYYMNLFLRNTDLKGKTLDLTFRNFYTSRQIQAVYDGVCAFDDDMRNAYIRNTLGEDALDGLPENVLPDSFDVDDWKAYRKEQNADQRILEKYDALYAASDTALDGTWHTEITMDFPVDEPIVASYDYGEIKLQTLSVQISYPTEMDQEDQDVEFVLTLKDGRKVASDADPETLPDGYIENAEAYADWNADETIQTEVICYSEPIAPQDVAEITMIQYEFCWNDDAPDEENGWIVTNEKVIYTAS